jgi:NitT/TauT family transport system ATP-binding protein
VTFQPEVETRHRARADSAGGPVLSLDRVRLGYWGRRHFHLAVEEATFHVAARERVIVIGQSGSGKSTLLKAVAGFLPPAGGTITVAGRTSLAPGPDRAVVFQEFDQLFPWRTVIGNVAYPMRVNGWRRKEAAARARHYVELTGLTRAADRYPHELSGGMKQRVAIARALALEPLILLMDEPFGSLDAQTRMSMQELLLQVWDRHHQTVLFITHDIEEALLLADRVCVLTARPGRIKKSIDVRIPRPRAIEVTTSPEFNALRREVLALIREESARAMTESAGA